MKSTMVLILCLFFLVGLVSCTFSCDLLNSHTSGTVIESISAPFTIDDDTIFVNTTNRALEIKDYTYIIDINNRSIKSVITYKYGRDGKDFCWGPEQVVVANGKLWILGANYGIHAK